MRTPPADPLRRKAFEALRAQLRRTYRERGWLVADYHSDAFDLLDALGRAGLEVCEAGRVRELEERVRDLTTRLEQRGRFLAALGDLVSPPETRPPPAGPGGD